MNTIPDNQALRFCLVSTFYPPYNFGGDGIYAHRLANGLARLGHQVTVLHSSTAYEMLAGAKPSDSYKDHTNVTVRSIRTPLGKLGLLAVQQAGRPGLQAPALRRWLDRGSFDVIHYNNVSLLGGPHVFRYGSGLKLCTLIEHWLVCPMHVLWKFDREVCTKPSCFLCTILGRRPPQLWRYTGLMRRATRSIDAFIGPSQFTMRMHSERGLRGTMIQLPLFHTEPDLGPEPEPSVSDGSDDRSYFLFVGRLERIKGLQTIIPTFRKLSDVDLVVAGSGTYEQQLRRMAEGAPNIRFVGRADVRQLHRLYRDAIATIVPSLCYETFGIIVAESFAARTPVIVRDHSSLREFIESYGGGFTFSTEDELRSAIDRLRSDPELCDRLGRQGRVAYDAEFGEAPFLNHYLAVVRRLLATKQVPCAVEVNA
ncbi:MAG: glycosyltransferase family 4 protein [Planctomycetes bacterium]|nr:glycosyltransferase family 4 protein [Planctomycetota bacterium]